MVNRPLNAGSRIILLNMHHGGAKTDAMMSPTCGQQETLRRCRDCHAAHRYFHLATLPFFRLLGSAHHVNHSFQELSGLGSLERSSVIRSEGLGFRVSGLGFRGLLLLSGLTRNTR